LPSNRIFLPLLLVENPNLRQSNFTFQIEKTPTASNDEFASKNNWQIALHTNLALYPAKRSFIGARYFNCLPIPLSLENEPETF